MTELTFPAADLVVDDVTAHLAAGEGDKAPTLSGVAVPFGVPSGVAADGNKWLFEGPPANIAELVDVVAEHDDAALIGRLSAPWEVTDTALMGSARIFDTSRGRDVVTEAREGARTAFSVSAIIDEFTVRPDQVRVVKTWRARHLGVVRRPAFAEAQGITVNAHAHPDKETPRMETQTLAQPPTVETTKVEPLPTVAELAAKVSEHLNRTQQATHPLAVFGSFEDFTAAFQAADQDKRDELVAAFAIPDQVTTNNPGVIPPGWRTEIKMNLDARRPLIAGFGSIGLPDAGMDSTWPYFDGSLDGIIARQAAEKQELSGVRIDIKKAAEPIKTAGAVSDISYQLLMRSSPSYLQAYLRIMMAAWARYTERQFEAAILARGTNAGGLPSLADAKAVRAALFAASADAEDAAGSPANLVYVDRATFVTLGGLPDLYNAKYGTQNAAGTASASSLSINVNGLEVRRAPFFPASTMVVATADAAKFPESGAKIATEEEVTKLGRNVAVWGMYEDAEVYFPGAIRVYKPQA